MPIADALATLPELETRTHDYGLHRNYHAGRHRLDYLTPDFRQKYNNLVRSVAGVRENLCPAAITAFTDHLAITGWSDADAMEDSLVMSLDRLAAFVHRETHLSGDAFVLVWPGLDGRPRPRFHRADQIAPHVDPDDPDRLDYAAKPWIDAATGRGRVNIYYADRLERWVTRDQIMQPGDRIESARVPTENTTEWRPYDDDGDPDVIGHDFGAVPVCWWKRDADSPTGHGRSVLADVVPIQDALNASLASLIVGAEAFVRPLRWATGYRPEAVLNPTTGQIERQKVKVDPANESILTFEDSDMTLGQFDPTDPTKLVAVQDAYALKVARIIGAPAYYFAQTAADVPSGASLRTLTARLTSSVRAFQRDATPVWHGLMQLLGYDAWPTWEDPAPVDATERVQIAQAKRDLGYPFAELLTELGETPDDVARILNAERAEVEAAAFGVADR